MTIRLLVWFVAGFLLQAGPLWAAESGDPGRAMYLRYCSACHGPAGKGDGVVSQFLRPKPTDLTQITAKSGGAFPYQQMFKVIDGRQTVRAHGDPVMPVWGEVFLAEQGQGLDRVAIVRGKVMLITDYVESVQEP